MDNYIGKKLDGRYEISSLIGSGGMADVYQATDVVDQKVVAVKILKKEFAENEEFLRRFRNESKAIAVLSHPNIVKIYDVGFSEKLQFIVMEYIDGITLKDYMESQGTLNWKDSIHFITQILRALHHAHEHGIVHRDIKPQNIMVFSDGTIKVMDFGIAKFAREEGKTSTDQAIGSVHYISPEQARGDVTDEKSDLYSVGVVLYEMLTGKKPFDGDNAVSIALMHMQAEIPAPRSMNSAIPSGLEEIILHAMEKNPKDRYPSARAMLQDIEKFKEDPDTVFGYVQESVVVAASGSESPTRFFRPVTEPVAEPEEEDDEYYEDDDEYDYDDDDEYEEEEEGRSLFVPILTGVTVVVIIVAVVLIASLIKGALFDGTISSGSKEQAMPKLIGLDYNEAIEAYPDLDIQVTSREYSNYEKDIIFEQSIPEGNGVEKNAVL